MKNVSPMDLEFVKKAERKILEEAGRIEELEEQIQDKEKEILRAERKVLSEIDRSPFQAFRGGVLTKRQFAWLKKVVIRRIAKHKFLFSLFVMFGVVLVWRGVWELSSMIPILSSSFVALAVGILVLWLVNKYTEL
jgi:hypothetical protein